MTVAAPVLLSYRALGLGDLLTAVPALRALRGAYPGHHHILAAPAWLRPIIDLLDAVDEHLPVGELQPVPSSRRVDVAVNLHGSGPQSHQVIDELEPAHALAYHHPDVGWTQHAPRWDDDEHEIHRWCRLLWASGIAADPGELDLPPPDVDLDIDARGATVIHPGAKAPARRWPADRFTEVARHEVARGRRVVITGAVDEEALARAVAWAAGLRDDIVLAGRTDLAELAAVVSQAGRVVSGDTGVAHLATALGTPSVVIFGPTPPSQWGPPEGRRGRHRVLWAGRIGDPLADRPDPGLLRVSSAQVIAELDDLADGLRRPA